MFEVKSSKRFKRDLKVIIKRGYNIELLNEVVEKLSLGETLDEKYRDHILSGEYQGLRECHITPDWLLIYQILDNELILYLSRTGTHTKSQ